MRIALALIPALAVLALACTGSGGTEYEVIVRFNSTVTQADMDDVAEYLRSYDDGLDFLIQESFPPTGVARLKTDEPDFCVTVEAELEARLYVESVSCQERAESLASVTPDDQPVESP